MELTTSAFLVVGSLPNYRLIVAGERAFAGSQLGPVPPELFAVELQDLKQRLPIPDYGWSGPSGR